MDKTTTWYEPIIGLFYGNAKFMTHNVAFWFLPTLFITEVLSFIIYKFVKSKVILPIVVSILLIIGYTISDTTLPWSINIAFVALFFFYVGKSLRGLYSHIHTYIHIMTFIICMVLSFVFVNYINYIVDMASGKFGNMIGFISAALLGIISIISLSNIIKKSAVLEYIGKNTFVIYALHGHMYRVVIYIYATLCSVSIEELRSSYIMSFIVTVVSLVLLLIPIKLYNKYSKYLTAIYLK